ncbi:MAG: citrate/2-methylcitrate synthase, partial [Actinomycetales bacterium]
MSEFKPKKSVALSGVPAGNTALSTVGRSGNDLHYRGYDISDLALNCEFEEVAYLILYGELPTTTQLSSYKEKLAKLRDLPQAVLTILENIPKSAHPMDVIRTGVSALGCHIPEPNTHSDKDAQDVADRLIACTPSMLIYWYHFAYHGKRISLDTGA